MYEEYRIRQLFGDRPALAQYKTRYPDQFSEVEELAEQTALPTRTDAGSTATAHTGAVPGFAKDIVLAQTGGFTLVERLGTGAFAEVWKARAPGDVLKAIKIIIRPFDQAEAQRESASMELIKNLRHHFLLPVHAFWLLQDRLLILMDLAMPADPFIR